MSYVSAILSLQGCRFGRKENNPGKKGSRIEGWGEEKIFCRAAAGKIKSRDRGT